MEVLKKINVNLEEREFVRLDAIRANRQEKWQGLLSRLLAEWATSPAVAAPPGMRAILVPATLPDEDAALLEMAGSELARLAERERKDFADQAEHQRSRVKAIEPVEMQLKRRKAR